MFLFFLGHPGGSPNEQAVSFSHPDSGVNLQIRFCHKLCLVVPEFRNQQSLSFLVRYWGLLYLGGNEEGFLVLLGCCYGI